MKNAKRSSATDKVKGSGPSFPLYDRSPKASRMINAPKTLSKLLTSFALIFAMAVSALAHVGMRPALSPDLAEYVLAGGELSDLCGYSGEQDGARGQKCEACRLIGAALIPRVCHGVPVVISDQTRVLSFVAKRLHQQHPLDPTRQTRAPPQA